MRGFLLIAVSALTAALAAGCATTPPPRAGAELLARSGSQVAGSVDFSPTPNGLRVDARVSGLPAGQHGFHIHEVGDCSAADAASAKGHFNPGAMAHGDPGGNARHAGDLPNLSANAQGEAAASFELSGVTLSGADGIVGRSVVIHADADDYRSQPAGNSGKRIACGVIAAR